jgi:5-methylcytosine-specific restriction endonuclease McrA
MQDYPALVLNGDFRPLSYFPLSTLNWKDAVTAVFKDHVSVVAEYDKVARSPSFEMRLPSVVAMRSYVAMPRKVAFTRFNVFLRDRFECQYCGAKFAASDLTFEHVVPRSRGGVTAWDNIVAACDPCNRRKGNRTDIRPMRDPVEPDAFDLVAAKRTLPQNYLHESWLDYLYWDSEIEP